MIIIKNKNKRKSLDKRKNMVYTKGNNKNNNKKTKKTTGVLRMKKMQNQLVELLNIHGVSGDEKAVRDYLLFELATEKLVDRCHIDDYGNLLAEKTYGDGKGATVLLSAHMDTVRGVREDKELIVKNGAISAQLPNGERAILGADDRAGIAIILTVLRNMSKVRFNGKIKVAFSREEEIGCVGSTNIRKNWYEGTDLAIVVDRRGSRDIVVGCGQPFCSNEVGLFMQDVAQMADLDFKCVEGGISDALTFSENGINSVNLSAGYYNEHTEKEYVVISEMKQTVRLMMQVFAIINQFSHTFNEVPDENMWVTNWYPTGKYASKYDVGYFEDVFMQDLYAEEFDTHGDVMVYEMGADVVISQGDNEIMLTRESLKGLINQLSGSLN
ncbi:peptidase [Bacillus phage vB_BanS_Chewbecca]|uniref:Metallo-aminopeptidase n=1 Tax=Bacillus phage vB_BanS_Chewbecca TaxID=2894786 RepID=A0AAE8YMN4_9CAUD|nr:peptidase [Bacillus phage vB_BanS_Chewbecca]UGO46104.1 putative metallo-aminopeptidase [Bacillus phage vB_BanS_Chewbecca]